MRINLYAEEVTSETELVRKTVVDDEFGERTFYGLRLYLHSPDVLHHSKDDDDRSAITIFVPWTKADGHGFHVVEKALDNLRYELSKARSEDDARQNEEWKSARGI